MSDEVGWLSLLGIKVQDIGAGIAGGSAAAILTRKAGVTSVLSIILLGAITSAYVTPWATMYVGTMGGAVGFFIGLGAVPICEAAKIAVAKWFPLDKPPTIGGPK